MKINFKFFNPILFLGLMLYSCEYKSDSKTQAEEEEKVEFDLKAAKTKIIEKTNRFTEAHITRDTAFLNSIFTKDANGYPPNSDIITGRAAIAAVNSQWVNYGIKEFTEESTSFYGNEEYLIDEGTYYLRFGEDNIIDKGKYINIWKIENGEWKICSNIWNTSLPLTTNE